MVNTTGHTAKEAAKELSSYLLKSVTKGMPYDILRVRMATRRPPMEIIYIFIGFAIGLVAAIIYYGKPQGNLRVDRSDPDGPYFFLEIKKPISSILKRKTIVLQVRCKNFLTRK